MKIDDLIVIISESHLQQLILNLILNSKDALPNGGEISINISKSTYKEVKDFEELDIIKIEYVHIVIIDNGKGIKKEHMDDLFEPFFTTKPIGEGVGLGLAQVYRIIRQYDGYINIYSVEKEGTEFHGFLPECKEEKREKELQKLFTLFHGFDKDIKKLVE
ncbi:MAG: sensor histidine kinase [Candidatus Heimdallarchaeaceae archaeon]